MRRFASCSTTTPTPRGTSRRCRGSGTDSWERLRANRGRASGIRQRPLGPMGASCGGSRGVFGELVVAGGASPLRCRTCRTGPPRCRPQHQSTCVRALSRRQIPSFAARYERQPEAIKKFEAALREDPYFAEAWVALSETYTGAGIAQRCRSRTRSSRREPRRCARSRSIRSSRRGIHR